MALTKTRLLKHDFPVHGLPGELYFRNSGWSLSRLDLLAKTLQGIASKMNDSWKAYRLERSL